MIDKTIFIKEVKETCTILKQNIILLKYMLKVIDDINILDPVEIQQLKTTVANIEDSLEDITTDIDNLNTNFTSLSNKVDTLETRVDNIDITTGTLYTLIGNLESKVNSNTTAIQDINNYINSDIDPKLDKALVRPEDELGYITIPSITANNHQVNLQVGEYLTTEYDILNINESFIENFNNLSNDVQSLQQEIPAIYDEMYTYYDEFSMRIDEIENNVLVLPIQPPNTIEIVGINTEGKQISIQIDTNDFIIDGTSSPYILKSKYKPTQSETWLLNTDLFLPPRFSVSQQINFNSNGNAFDSIEILETPDLTVRYGSMDVYSWGWTNEGYRTITFETPPTGDLLTWLELNGVKQ